ncbi:hypothetical protein K438DRAFT_2049204 [Mycena galopus ATCC 62051]|nr:hypothetical protein K438DRAFT_2049204 [Mycena galopus ATCC 62051]
MSLNNSSLATIEQFLNRPPEVRDRKFENAARNYFGYKGMADDQKMGVIVGCLHNERHLNWLDPDPECERVLKFTFPQFMAEFRKKYLKPDWEHTTWNKLLNSKMKNVEQPFDEWYTQVASIHALLANTPSALDATCLCHILEAGMCEDLVYDYSRDVTAMAVPVANLEQWLTEVRRIDKKWLCKLSKQHRLAAEYARVEKTKAKKRKAPNDGDHSVKKLFGSSAKANSTGALSSTAGGQPKGCPGLTDEECTLLDTTAAAADKKTQKTKAVAVIMHKVNDKEDSEDSVGSDDLDHTGRTHRVRTAVAS